MTTIVARKPISRRERERRRKTALSVDELAIFLDGDRELTYRVLRLLRIRAYGDRPPLVQLDRLETWQPVAAGVTPRPYTARLCRTSITSWVSFKNFSIPDVVKRSSPS
jgi:hypothetical protein